MDWILGMLRPWELNVNISRESGTSIHVQIAQKIIEEIQNGRFAPGVALPGTREFASKINVNRKTVVQAYDELIAQGWLTSENKRGTFVSSRFLTVNNTKLNGPSESQLNSTRLLTNATYSSLNKKQIHEFIHFSDGLSDTRLIPFESIARAMRHALIVSARNTKSAHSDPKGTLILREAIMHMLNMERGLHTNPDNICVVRGWQMGIFIISKVFIKTGDNVVVEQLSNPHARDAFKNCGANIISVPHDENGIDVESLEEICRQTKISVVYVTPHHQIPTTVTMSQSRRERLLKLADEYEFLIIEDDTNHEFNFSGASMLPIANMQKTKRVIYVGSLSKVLTSGLCVGYIVASEDIIKTCANRVMLIDSQGNQLIELAVAELMHTGEIKKHISRTVKVYSERRALLSNLLQNELNPYVNFQQADTGLAFWLKLDSKINIEKLEHSAALQKVHFQSGNLFSSYGGQVNGIRMGFANLNYDETVQGVARLKRAFQNIQ